MKNQRRTRHVGLVVEGAMYDQLREIADKKYMTLSTFIYSILKEWLKKQEDTENTIESAS